MDGLGKLKQMTLDQVVHSKKKIKIPNLSSFIRIE